MGVGLCIGIPKLSIEIDNVSTAREYVEYESSYATFGGPSMELVHE